MADCAAKFYASSRFLRGFDIDRFTGIWTNFLQEDLGVIFALFDGDEIRGALGGLLSADLYSGERYSQELFWWIEPEFRGSGLWLYRQFEAWARDRGCAEIRMINLADSMSEQLDTVYRRLGFELIEKHWGKPLR